MARAQGARAQMALACETTYGTPPASGFTKMPFASTTLGAEQPLLNSELLGYGRDPLAPIKDAVTADGDVTVRASRRRVARDLVGAPILSRATGPVLLGRLLIGRAAKGHGSATVPPVAVGIPCEKADAIPPPDRKVGPSLRGGCPSSARR